MKFPFRDTVVQHAPWEMFLMRLFLLWPCWGLVQRVVVNVQPVPNGLAHFVHLGFLANPTVQSAVVILFLIGGLLYVLDWCGFLGLTSLLAILLAKGTLVNSQGSISHSLQLLTLVFLAQWIVRIVGFFQKWAKTERQIRQIHWSKVIIVASYLSTAFCKLFASNVFWIARVPYLALQIIKSNLQSYYTDLEPMTTGWVAQFPYWVANHPNLARLFFGGGLLLECFAFLALINRRWAFFIGVAMLTLHESINILMSLDFKIHVYLWLIFFVNVPWLVFLGLRRSRVQPVVSA